MAEEQYSVAQMYASLRIHTLVAILTAPAVLAIMNKATKSPARVFTWTPFHFFGGSTYEWNCWPLYVELFKQLPDCFPQSLCHFTHPSTIGRLRFLHILI